MRCLNKSGNRHMYNRHSLESIEVTRGNTATHSPTTLSTANSAKRRPTAPTFTTTRLNVYVPSNRTNLRLFRWRLRRDIITVWFFRFLFYHFDKLFIYLLNFLNSFDSQTVGLICVNLLIDFVASSKWAECDAPKASISCHNIYLVIYSIFFYVLLM